MINAHPRLYGHREDIRDHRRPGPRDAGCLSGPGLAHHVAAGHAPLAYSSLVETAPYLARAARAVHFFHNEMIPAFLLTFFAKNEKENMPKAELNALARFVEVVKRGYRR